MALMPRGSPRSTPDPLSDAWDRAAALNRRLQAGSFGDDGRRAPPPFTPLERRLRDADMSNADWQRLRAAQVRGEEPTVEVTAPRKGGHPTVAAGTIDTNVPYGPITLDQILVAGAKTGELGGEKIRRHLPADREQLWTARGLFTDYEGKITSAKKAKVAGGYDAVIHSHPDWSEEWPGPGDYGKDKPVYGIAGSRVWVIPPGSDKYYWLK